VKYLLDTNVISETRNPNYDSAVKAHIDKIPDEELFMSILSVGEISFGIEKLPSGKKKAELTQWLHDKLIPWFQDRIITLDQEIMLEWGRLRAQVGRTLPAVDSLLAASALTHRLTIITRNTHDFDGITGLSLLNPWEE
jgi:predicted nucleic acid-binding protein